MGCSNNRGDAKSLLPIVSQRVKLAPRTPKAAREPKPKMSRPVRDFHCPACGLVKPDYPNYRHVCPGEQPVDYQVERESICGQCDHARDGVCLPLKTIHPDRPCLIDVGIAMPGVQCPLHRWRRVMFACGKCGSIKFDPTGLTQCPVCHPKKPKSEKSERACPIHENPV